MVIGPSGSGKSSLVFAGVIPALRQGQVENLEQWRIVTMRPGEPPLSALTNVLGEERQESDNVNATVLTDSREAPPCLLVIEQFEELFTLAQEEEAIPFQERLQQFIARPNCYVVLTVRADFYPDVITSQLWPQIQAHNQVIRPLDHAGLRAAILKPAEQVGVFVETTLVERLVADAAGEPGVLPLVQETLSLLWQGVERRFLPLYAYEALSYSGEASGRLQDEERLTGLQIAIARHADTTLAPLDESQQHIARRIFLRLIHFGEGRPDTRRQQPVKALCSADDARQAFESTLEHLTTHRLLARTGIEHAAEDYVDIAHDALIDGWPTLKVWIRKWKEAEQVKRRLEEKVAEWERLEHQGGLLDEKTFPEVEAWITSSDALILGYAPNLVEFIETSRNNNPKTVNTDS